MEHDDFALYYTLRNTVKAKNFKPRDVDEQLSYIKYIYQNADKKRLKQLSLVIMLVIDHYSESNDDNHDSRYVPYYGVEKDGEIVFSMSDLPRTLQQMIFELVNLSCPVGN